MKNNEQTVKTTAESVALSKQKFFEELVEKALRTRKTPASINGLAVSREEALSWDYR